MSVISEIGLERWEAERARLAGMSPGESSQALALREHAWAKFASMGFPTIEDEEWRLTNVSPIARGQWTIPGAVPADEKLMVEHGLGSAALAELVFVNGIYDAERSRGSLETDVTFRTVASAMRSPNGTLAALGRQARGDQPFVALNTAFMRDGAILDIGDGVRAGVIHLVFLSAPGPDGPSLSTPRVLIRAGRKSEVTVVETHTGRGSYFSNSVTEIESADGAIVDHYEIVSGTDESYHVGTIAARQGRDSWLRSRLVGLGGTLVRTDLDAVLAGEGSGVSLDGLYILRDSQHFDAHTRIVHASPHTESVELYKGVLGDRSRGVFNGIIVVRPGAQKTTSRQTNKNLLLSNEAIADSNPQLEIHADDVKCNHGSTIGQLDESALFYLRSRGIGLDEARGMLTYAFAGEVVEKMRVEPVRKRLEQVLLTRLPLSPERKDRS